MKVHHWARSLRKCPPLTMTTGTSEQFFTIRDVSFVVTEMSNSIDMLNSIVDSIEGLASEISSLQTERHIWLPSSTLCRKSFANHTGERTTSL